MSALLSDSPLALIETPEDLPPMLQAEAKRLGEVLQELPPGESRNAVIERLEKTKAALSLVEQCEEGIIAYAKRARLATAQMVRWVWSHTNSHGER